MLIVILIFLIIGLIVGIYVESPGKYVPFSGYVSLFILIFFIASVRGGGIQDWESFQHFFMADPAPKRIMALPLFCALEGFAVAVVSRWILNRAKRAA